MKEQSAIAIVNDYPVGKFNLLIPMKTMQEISPMHKVVVNQVQISPNPDDKDVYKEGNEFALTKKALAKLMAAANIQVTQSVAILTRKCSRCAEIAGKTKIAPNCGTCPYADDVAHQVTLHVPEPSGTWRRVVATREICMADEKGKMTDAQYKRFFPFRSEQCESKALNRALRSALMISSSYKEKELQKPFVVAYIVPNMDDPEMKKIAASQYASSMNMMFGGNKEVKQISSTTVINPDDDPEELQQGESSVVETEVMPEGTPSWLQEDVKTPEIMPDENIVTCQGCAEIIEPNGKWTVEAICDFSRRNFKDKVFCPNCQKKARAQGGQK